MPWLILGCLVPSMVVCWAAAFAVRRWGPRWGLVDRPGHRKIHAAPMPTAGGLAIWLGIVLPLLAGQIALWIVGCQSDLDFAAGVHRAARLRPAASARASSGNCSPAAPP